VEGPGPDVVGGRAPDTPDAASAGGCTARHSEYVPVITFAYTVAGRSHQGTRYDLSNSPDMRLPAVQEVVRRYPAGTRTTCYVNPRDESEAVLTRGASRSLTFDGQRFWSNHRVANETVAFAVSG
jgi:hypothetical protein